MNLEVARLRATPGADAGRVAPFAAAAAEAHDESVAMTRALLALGRAPATGGCDVREVTEHVVALLAPGVRAKGGALTLDAVAVRTGANAAHVRDAVAAALLDATVDAGARVECRVGAEGEATVEVVRDGVVTATLGFASG